MVKTQSGYEIKCKKKIYMIKLKISDNKLILTFDYYWQEETNYEVSFSFSYPYSYERCNDLMRELTKKYKDDEEIYFHKEVIAYSPELRYNFLKKVLLL